jgi:signal transduction histidine kinase
VEAAVRLRRPRLRDVALVACAGAYAVAVIAAVPRSSLEPLTTYAGASIAARAADLTAGLSLIGVGVLAWFEVPTRRVALVAMLAGGAWFGPDWDGWDGGPVLARSLGSAAAPFVLALVFHLVTAFPSGRLRTRLAAVSIVVAYGLAAIASVGLALFRDPFLDPYCWRNCLENAFLLRPEQRVESALGTGWSWAAAGIGSVLCGSAAWRLMTASRTARGVLWPVLLPGLLFGATQVAYSLALLRTPFEDPHARGFSAIFLVRSLAASAVALGVAHELARTLRRRATIAHLATELGEAPPPGRLRDVLSAAVGDPALSVAYWLPGAQRFVDRDGCAIAPPVAGHGRAVTPILRGGQPVAVVIHDAAVADGPRLERELGGAVRLAVENEQLQAEILAQLADLRASRVRIVELGDAARRRLERDLHDGAQQRMLALSYEIRLAQAAAAEDDDAELVAQLAAGSDEAQATLADLRTLAHGIYPAILGESGLARALETLTTTAPLPVELSGPELERLPDAVESAAYAMVSEAVADATSRHATFVAVTFERQRDRLVLEAHDDGDARTTGLVHVADRVGALGGTLHVAATDVRAELPCA